MIIPDINLEEMEKFKKKNFEQRLVFIENYTKWLKTKKNKEWSTQQKEVLD